MSYVLPKLPYARGALAPHISKATLDLHHGKHHKAYVDKTNELAAAAGHKGRSLVDLIRTAKPGPLFNNAGQLWNHSFFWQCLSPDVQKPSAKLKAQVDSRFGSVNGFKKAFSEVAVAHFSSGWAWLVLKNDVLEIIALDDGDTPVAHKGMLPLFTLDVWEHAYYLDYRNERPKFVKAVMNNLVNWAFVAANLDGKGVSRADQR